MLQPIIDTIVQALIGALVSLLIVAVVSLRKQFEAWLETRTTVKQREFIHKLAGEGMALAESAYTSGGGPQKLDAALKYVTDHMKQYGVTVSEDAIRAAVEKAVLDYNAQVKGGEKGANI